MKTTSIIITLFLLLTACASSELDIDAYFKYLAEPSNGLYKTNRVQQFEIRARYLPVDYLIYKDYKRDKNLTTINIDSLKENYQGSLTFLLQIAPNKAEGHEFDVMTQTVSTVTDFKSQSHHMNFEMQEHLSLKIGDQVFKPVLVELENTYELTQHRNFMVTYALDAATLASDYKSIDFVYQDELFGTGIHHFLFEQRAIEKTPTIKL